MTTENRLNKQEEENAIVEALETSTDEKVIAMLIDLKKYGEIFFVKTLLNMLIGNRSEMVKKAVIEYISDIKIQDAAQLISTHVAENFENADVTSIVMASWQSQLDFSKYLRPYVEVLINGEYMIAIEAFTVIENALYSLTADEVSDYEAKIKKSIPKADKDKQLLLLEMISLIEKAKRATD